MPRRSDDSRDRPEMGELSRRVAAGDRGAFDAVHDRLAGGLLRLFDRRLAGRADVADELAQQTWARAWDAITRGRYQPQRAAISTFVYAVANNVWLQFCRTLRSPGQGPPTEEPAAPGRHDALLEYAELIDALRGCLRQPAGPNALADDERLVVLATARGETERQLAVRLGLAASTINARKQSAYAKMRACLAAKGFSRQIIEQMDLLYE